MGASASKAKRFQPAAEAGKKAIDLSVKTKHQHIAQEHSDPNRSTPAPMASITKNEDIIRDGGDHHFAKQIMDLGAVKLTESEVRYEKNNPVLSALLARESLDSAAQAEAEDYDRPRTLLNPSTIAGILDSQKAGEKNISRDYNLAKGVASKLKYVSSPEYDFLETRATETERHRDTYTLEGSHEEPELKVKHRVVQVGTGRPTTAAGGAGPSPASVPGQLPDDIFGEIAQAFEDQAKDDKQGDPNVPKSRHQQDQDFFNREKERRYPKRKTEPFTVTV